MDQRNRPDDEEPVRAGLRIEVGYERYLESVCRSESRPASRRGEHAQVVQKADGSDSAFLIRRFAGRSHQEGCCPIWTRREEVPRRPQGDHGFFDVQRRQAQHGCGRRELLLAADSQRGESRKETCFGLHLRRVRKSNRCNARKGVREEDPSIIEYLDRRKGYLVTAREISEVFKT